MNKEKKLIPELRFPEFVNEGEWGQDIVDNLVLTVTPPKKLTSSDYQVSGKFPIIDQSKNYYCGWTNYTDAVISKDLPLIIFGDHTCILKIAKEPFVQGADGIKILKAKNKIYPEYLFHYLKHNEVKIEDYKRHFSILKDRIVVFPNIENGEQQKIASCLSSLDEVIAAHSQKLAILKDHKKGLMQNLFPQEGEMVPKLQFPEFVDDGEWVETTVENNCEIKGRIGYRGYTTQDIVGQGEGALVLGGKHIQNQLLELKDPTYLSWDKYYESPEIIVEVGHIIFSQRGTLGDCAIIDREIGPTTINPSMVLIKNLTCDVRFLYYILIGDCIQEEVRKNRSKGAIPMLSQKQIKEFSFLIPKPQEQQKIASCLSSLDALITAQAEKIEQLKQHKKGLMQGLFP
jgi:type I restriction enzyme, S subunit